MGRHCRAFGRVDGCSAAPFAAISRRFPAAGRALPCGILAAPCCLPGFAFGPSTVLRTGFVAGGVSRGHGGRCARGGSVVRFLPRAVLCEVAENGADGGGFFDAGHDPHRAATLAAGVHVDVEDALEALCLRSSHAGAQWGCGEHCWPQSTSRPQEDVCRAQMASAARAALRPAQRRRSRQGVTRQGVRSCIDISSVPPKVQGEDRPPAQAVIWRQRVDASARAAGAGQLAVPPNWQGAHDRAILLTAA